MTAGPTSGHGDGGPSQRAVPYVCPFCGEEDLRPVEEGGWHCRSCLRVFSVTFHGLRTGATTPAPPGSTLRGNTP